ncbi:MAG: hypothetical protein H6993_04405 [Pseudomonadales bacterium]|nr:hypothetical protein [Pseudomonadales bacterium]
MPVFTPPIRKCIALVLAPMALLLFAGTAGADTGAVTGRVHFDLTPAPRVGDAYRGRTLKPVQPADEARALVWLEREDGRYPPPDELADFDIAQQGYQFRPGIMAVRTGTRVHFPNHDDEFHSVFSYSQARRFDLGRYRKDEEAPAVLFDQPGIVKIYCEIHKHMRSVLMVLDSPWFTSTATDGSYRLTGVPAGNYLLKAYLPDDRQFETTVAVTPDATTHQNLGE